MNPDSATILIPGSSHPELAEKLAKKVNAKIVKPRISIFANNELRIQIPDDISSKHVIIMQTLSHPTERHFFELAFISDAVKRLKPKSFVALIPWMAYSLQDQKYLPGEPVSAKVISGFLDSLGLDMIILVDIHSQKSKNYFKTDLSEILFSEIFSDTALQERTNKSLIVSPDSGSETRGKNVANLLKSPLLVLEKSRDRRTGKLAFENINKNLKDYKCIICDDMIITGGTLIKSASLLKQAGAGRIIAIITHPLLEASAEKRLAVSDIDKLYFSDTVPYKPRAKSLNIKIVSSIPQIYKSYKNILNRFQ